MIGRGGLVADQHELVLVTRHAQGRDEIAAAMACADDDDAAGFRHRLSISVLLAAGIDAQVRNIGMFRLLQEETDGRGDVGRREWRQPLGRAGATIGGKMIEYLGGRAARRDDADAGAVRLAPMLETLTIAPDPWAFIARAKT